MGNLKGKRKEDERFEIGFAEDGQLVVDKSRLYHMNAGADPDDQYPESIVKV
jgi:hypothetical protein